MKRKLVVTQRKDVIDVTLKMGTSGRFMEFTLAEAKELQEKLAKLLTE